MNEDELKDKMVAAVAELSKLISEYVKVMGLDAYECTMEFVAAGPDIRIRVTDNKYRVDPKTGKLERLPKENNDPNASSLDDAEDRRQAKLKGNKPISPEPSKTPEQTVADLMKRLRLK